MGQSDAVVGSVVDERDRDRLVGQQKVGDIFPSAAKHFLGLNFLLTRLIAADVNGDMACTVGHAHTRASVSGEPGQYSLRVRQIYRREDGDWMVAHCYADALPHVPLVPAEVAPKAEPGRDA